MTRYAACDGQRARESAENWGNNDKTPLEKCLKCCSLHLATNYDDQEWDSGCCGNCSECQVAATITIRLEYLHSQVSAEWELIINRQQNRVSIDWQRLRSNRSSRQTICSSTLAGNFCGFRAIYWRGHRRIILIPMMTIHSGETRWLRDGT